MSPSAIAAALLAPDPEADALIDAAYADPDGPTIYADIVATVDHGEATLSSLLDLLELLRRQKEAGR